MASRVDHESGPHLHAKKMKKHQRVGKNKYADPMCADPMVGSRHQMVAILSNRDQILRKGS